MNMSVKTKNVLIRLISWLLAGGGMVLITIFQYFSTKNQAPIAIKIAVPALLGLLIAFLVYYKSIKAKISRKLTAIQTAKELGQVGQTNTIVANLLDTLGVVLPLLLIGAIFVIGGKYLVMIGAILFEILGLYSIIIVGNVLCDNNKNQELKEKEANEQLKMAESIATKIEETIKKYE